MVKIAEIFSGLFINWEPDNYIKEKLTPKFVFQWYLTADDLNADVSGFDSIRSAVFTLSEREFSKPSDTLFCQAALENIVLLVELYTYLVGMEKPKNQWQVRN